MIPEPRGTGYSDRDRYRNPASPAVVRSSPTLDISRASSATPTASSTTSSQATQPNTPTNIFTPDHSGMQTSPQSQPQSQTGTPMPTQTFRLPSPISATSSRTPTTPTSPTRARSTSDLLSEHEKWRREEREQHSAGRNAGLASPNVRSRGSLNALSSGRNGSGEGTSLREESNEQSRDVSVRESLVHHFFRINGVSNFSHTRRAPPWMTLDELLNKLLFMAVSDDGTTCQSGHFNIVLTA